LNKPLLAKNPLQLALAFDALEAAPPPSPADPLTSVAGRRTRRLSTDAGALFYVLRRARRRTIGFQIDDAGLTVSAPRWVTLREIEAAIVEKERWIRAKLSEWRAWRAERKLPEVRFAEGGTLPYLGKSLVMRLRADAGATALAQDTGTLELHIALPAEANELQVRDAVQAWLQAEARRILGERLELLSQRIETKPRGWALSSARSQWGSCNADGRIRLNWRLVHFAMPVIDYVVAHELAHLKELNHSPRFWSAVAQLLPGFEAARDEIKEVDLSALPV
jgi:predicted metal-dependent hydrolase